MKPKLILHLALFLSGAGLCVFNNMRAYGYTAIIRINHTNIKTDYPFLNIKSEKFINAESIFFTITVVPQNSEPQRNFSGHLEVNDVGKNGQPRTIVSTSVEAEKHKNTPTEKVQIKDECVAFHFMVEKKYLAASNFRVEETYGEFDSGPSDYIINLQEFAGEK